MHVSGEISLGRRASAPTSGARNSFSDAGEYKYGNEPLHVLIVEDNPGDAELVEELLDEVAGRKYRTQQVPTLARAVEALSERRPDVVLLDVGLPDSRGLDTVRAICRSSPGCPVVVLTGRDDEEIAAKAVREGAQEFLGKEMITSSLLVRAIRHSIERQRLLSVAERQRQLARSAEQELRRLVARNVDAMVIADLEGTVLLANEAARGLLESDPGSLEGVSFPYADVADREEVEFAVGEELRRVELLRADIEWAGAPARLFVLHDVTDRVRAEEMRQRLLHADRLKSIGQLAAGVAHEVNNPAAFVLANEEALQEHVGGLQEMLQEARALAGGWSREAQESLEGILHKYGVDERLNESWKMLHDNRTGMMRIRGIVRGLLAFARSDREEVEWLSLHEVVDDAQVVAANEVRHRARLEVVRGEVPVLAGHRGKLTQVVVNLLVNAAHAIDETTEDNRITVRTFSDADGSHISVEDTGRGMSEETQRRIFEPFFTRKARGGGTGLGVPLSAELARQHGGELRVHSVEGKGSRFDVILPRDTGLAPPCAREREDTPEAQRSTARGRILIIDDEPMLLKAFRRMLRGRHEIVVAEGGRAGLDIIERDTRFDAVVCDLMMPGIDGSEIYKRLGELAPRLRRRLVFVSGGAVTGSARAFVESLSTPLLEKPVSATQLYEALELVFGDDGAEPDG